MNIEEITKVEKAILELPRIKFDVDVEPLIKTTSLLDFFTSYQKVNSDKCDLKLYDDCCTTTLDGQFQCDFERNRSLVDLFLLWHYYTGASLLSFLTEYVSLNISTFYCPDIDRTYSTMRQVPDVNILHTVDDLPFWGTYSTDITYNDLING